jgi:hypothetical protein
MPVGQRTCEQWDSSFAHGAAGCCCSGSFLLFELSAATTELGLSAPWSAPKHQNPHELDSKPTAPNPSTRNARKERTFLRRRRRRVLPGAAAPRGGRSRRILLGPPGRGRCRRRRGLRLVKDHKFRSVSRRVKSGGGDVGFLDPLGGAVLSPWAASGKARTKFH